MQMRAMIDDAMISLFLRSPLAAVRRSKVRKSQWDQGDPHSMLLRYPRKWWRPGPGQ